MKIRRWYDLTGDKPAGSARAFQAGKKPKICINRELNGYGQSKIFETEPLFLSLCSLKIIAIAKNPFYFVQLHRIQSPDSQPKGNCDFPEPEILAKLP